MRRILLLGMVVLLGMVAHADDRNVIFEETFAEGLGSFTVIDEGFPDPKPETWHWDESGQIVVNGGDYNFVDTLEPAQPDDGTYYLC